MTYKVVGYNIQATRRSLWLKNQIHKDGLMVPKDQLKIFSPQKQTSGFLICYEVLST